MVETSTSLSDGEEAEYESWYKWGVRVLYVEMLIAIGVTAFALYMAFTGAGGVLS